ncbi:uncharacterized protein PITG_02956 [Phytophthora infestans T30-4]|uniref:Uncharacterized protein n=1 Tax=Phytophthora infestans (strain T30-4) TaxID=403677 RepID=D0MXK9_PHYIT|nr:uncharacterized protein PITG_02956 [Phytophthora infestans T30-4]EEY64372.1 hypothetical protein PITG_02956 [Phytophthora infestans T30-4]|eukprot:XP_002907808.1 hypothetical protein PITG_02956 [Phytophthora infestans T30-4]
MGVSSDHETPDTSSSSSYLVPPARNGFLASNASFVAVAGCTATPADKLSNPVIHSTAWRRLIFEDAPPNILEGVAAIPYAIGSDKPLWDYDKTGRLKEKCKFVDAVGQGVAMTEDNFEMLCHARRVRRIVRDTRKQVSEYLQTHQVMRSERYRRLQWSEIASNRG